ncbi:MAG: hypothetical protein LBR00_03010 [Clostridiales Family XIII bacterium]|nr:hypothetical protein [Clostridiales Family XIII bacterium]
MMEIKGIKVKSESEGGISVSDLNARRKRFEDAAALKEPDRVPVCPPMQCWPILRAGCTMKDALYDFDKGAECYVKYVLDFEPDQVTGHQHVYMGKGKILERMKSKTLIWAGDPKGRVPDNSIHQFVEYPVLLGEEMPFFQRDYTGWLLEKGLPKISDLLTPFEGLGVSRLGPSYDQSQVAAAFSAPGVRRAIEELWAIHEMNEELAKKSTALDDRFEELGFPVMTRGIAMVPFDEYSDFIRGTVDTMIDLFDHQDLIRKFCDARLEHTLEFIRAQGRFLKGRCVFMPLHKGMDKFMSDEQFRDLYWCDLRTIIEEIIKNGMTPYIYTEGPYNSRLPHLTEVPKGKVIFHFEDVDMAGAKKILGGTACIAGGFPVWLLEFGTKERVVEECKRLLDACAPGGGYIFETGCGFDGAKEENVEAMFETVKTLGKY